MLKAVALIACMLLPVRGWAEWTINVPAPRSEFDQSHDYHSQLLRMAMQASSDETLNIVIESRIPMVESRAAQELKKGDTINVFWMGTDRQKERDLHAIRVPTTRGLIGFRKFIIHQQQRPIFEQVASLKDLSKRVACQGQDWPDTEILRHAKLPVTTSVVYESLFRMVFRQRCDYFPRGYHDHQQELSTRREQYPELINYEGLMLHYPFAVYFFTAKSNTELAKRIEQGMERLIDKGALLNLMQTHPLTQAAFPLAAHPPRHTFFIDNPTLPNDTPYTDDRYWFQPSDFSLANPDAPAPKSIQQ